MRSLRGPRAAARLRSQGSRACHLSKGCGVFGNDGSSTGSTSRAPTRSNVMVEPSLTGCRSGDPPTSEPTVFPAAYKDKDGSLVQHVVAGQEVHPDVLPLLEVGVACGPGPRRGEALPSEVEAALGAVARRSASVRTKLRGCRRPTRCRGTTGSRAMCGVVRHGPGHEETER